MVFLTLNKPDYIDQLFYLNGFKLVLYQAQSVSVIIAVIKLAVPMRRLSVPSWRTEAPLSYSTASLPGALPDYQTLRKHLPVIGGRTNAPHIKGW